MKKALLLPLALLLGTCLTACSFHSNSQGSSDSIEDNITIDGGWNTSKSRTAIDNNPKAKAAFEKATSSLVGMEYEAVSLLGTQTVSGTNYSVLCLGTGVFPGAQPAWVILYIYEDPDGNCSILREQNLTLDISEETDTGYEDYNESTQIANPWCDYATIDEAVQASGVPFMIPDMLSGTPRTSIQATDCMIDVIYGEPEVLRLRKAKGTEDISGDYNEYDFEENMELENTPVTLKGNRDQVFLAVWNDGTCSYAYYSTNGIDSAAAREQITTLIQANHEN
ncbi:MAG: hypothetical protein MJ071_03845 [Oscillospiraceae bacterium]|nr:hypothetical protein [Oscillospiraceae bacterium]